MNDDPKFLTIGGIRFVTSRDLPRPKQCDECDMRGPCDDMASDLYHKEKKSGIGSAGCGDSYYKVVTRG